MILISFVDRIFESEKTYKSPKLFFYNELENFCLKAMETNIPEKISCPAHGDSGGPLIYENQINT